MEEKRPPRIQGGGRMGPQGYLFELTGGSLCLDLVNTLDQRPKKHPRELLNHYNDLVTWARQAGILTSREEKQLGQSAERRPGEARSVLRRARALREDLYALFSALADRRSPSPEVLGRVNAALPRALIRLRVVKKNQGFEWDWSEDPTLDRMLWPVLRSAAELLTSTDRDLIRECAAESCAWLFLDRSRNRSRRWCDMSVCGNRDKARRHYRKVKGKSG